MKKVFFTIFFVFLFSTYAISARWTVMVYMAADNNLADAALFDIEEMVSVGSTQDVNIVVQVDTNPVYGLSSDATTRRLYIQKNNIVEFPLNTNIDSSSPQSLTDFINWAKTSYPAEHYLLVLWDHGGGWKTRGVLADDTSGHIMSIDDLAYALSNSGIHFDIIDFDACLMGMYEVAYTLRNNADYLVFSEETEPGEGDAYNDFLNVLTQNPSISSVDLAKQIVLSYYNYFSMNEHTQTGVTKSVCDLRYIEILNNKIHEFVSNIKNYVPSLIQQINNSIENSQSFQVTSYRDMYNLFHNFKINFNSHVPRDIINIIDDILSTIKNNLIVFYKTYNPEISYSIDFFDVNRLDDANGISIYMPSSRDITTSELNQYAMLQINREQNSWYEFIDTFLKSIYNQPVSTVPGKFSWAIAWLGPWGEFPSYADVDLYIVEPCPQCAEGIDIYAPYMGMSTQNGHFSPDSIDTNPYKSVEIYTANDEIYSGTYLALAMLNCDYINPWDTESQYADTLFYISDSNTGYNFILTDERVLSCLNPAPPMEYWTEDTVYKIIYGFYTNWWIIYGEDK